MKLATCIFCETELETRDYGDLDWIDEIAPIYDFPICVNCLKKLKEALAVIPEKEKP